MLEQTYKTMNEKLEPDKSLTAETLRKMELLREGQKPERGREKTFRRPIPIKRAAAVALACILTAALSLTAVAAAVPGFRAMLFGGGNGELTSSAPLAQVGAKLTEIENAAAERDGFRLEILGATHDGSSMMVYYTLTDTTGENRLNEKAEISPITSQFMDLQVSAAENGGGVRSFYSNNVLAYDPETGSLLCRYVLDTQNAKDMDLSHTDFAIGVILLDVQRINWEPLTLVESQFTTETMDLNGETVLKPGASPLVFDGTETHISAMGFIDGQLHVQFAFPENENLNLSLDPIDKVITPEEVAAAGGYTAAFEGRETDAWRERHKDSGTTGEDVFHSIWGKQYFFNMENGAPINASDEDFFAGSYQYQEYEYEISPEEMQYYNFYYFQQSNSGELSYFPEGQDSRNVSSYDFRVSFDLNAANTAEEKAVENLSIDGGTLSSVSVSGMGVTVTGDRKLAENAVITALYGGETVTFSKTITTGIPRLDSIVAVDRYEGPVTVRFAADRPIDPAELTHFTINGTEIPLD